MRPENIKMTEYLKENMIDGVRVKYLAKGSLRGCWRLYSDNSQWSEQWADLLDTLGFTGFDGKRLHKYSGNGGYMHIFARHNRTAEFIS